MPTQTHRFATPGSISVCEVQRGTVDLRTTSGRARSTLAGDDATVGDEDTLTLTARSVSGSVTVSPSTGAPAVL